MSSLRIGMFTEITRPIRNGVVASIETLAQTLREFGHDVTLVAPEMPGARDDDPHLVSIPSLPLPARTGYRLTVPLRTRERLDRALAGVDVIHTHSPFVTGWMGLRYARKVGVPVIFSYHTQLEHYAHYVPFGSRTTRRAVVEIAQRYANAVDAVIAPTYAMLAYLRHIDVTTDVRVVPSGIDLGTFANAARSAELRRSAGVGDDEKLVLWVGRLAREKNLELALDGFARAQAPARLVVVGDGPERAALERHAARAGLEGRVRFAGEAAPALIPAWYASADLLLFTSTTETQGLVLAEALASGLPILAIDSPQAREVLGAAATFSPPTAAELGRGLAAAIPTAVRRPEAGFERAAGFDRLVFGRRVLELYEGLLVAPV